MNGVLAAAVCLILGHDDEGTGELIERMVEAKRGLNALATFKVVKCRRCGFHEHVFVHWGYITGADRHGKS